MNGFAPVFLPDDRRLNGRVSQTMLRHYAACPRSGYLYALYKGEAKTREMVRGTALHTVIERATRLMIEHGEVTVPPEVVKDLTVEVLSELQVPFEEHDRVREMAHRWAVTTAIDPSKVIACETLVVLDVGGYEVRMRVDYAEMLDGGVRVLVRDYKSSRAMPAQEEVARKRPDGSLAAKSFQLVLYALGLAFGVPVRVEDCPTCGGSGIERIKGRGSAGGIVGDPCTTCDVRGIVEVREPFPLAAHAQHFDLEYVYPGIEINGDMGRRQMSLTRLELEEYRASLGALLANVARSEETGDWPAVVSDQACGECPAAVLCPIPRELRDHRGTVNTVEEAAEAASVLDREKAEHRARQAELRAFAKAHGGSFRFGKKLWELVTSTSDQISDKDGMWDAVERARLYGEPFDRSRFVKSVTRSDFRARDLTVDELSEGSNEEVEGDGEGRHDRRDADPERARAARYGDEPPW